MEEGHTALPAVWPQGHSGFLISSATKRSWDSSLTTLLGKRSGNWSMGGAMAPALHSTQQSELCLPNVSRVYPLRHVTALLQAATTPLTVHQTLWDLPPGSHTPTAPLSSGFQRPWPPSSSFADPAPFQPQALCTCCFWNAVFSSLAPSRLHRHTP